MKKSLLFLLHLLFISLVANATDYYTTSASATLTGNSTASANWTTSLDGTTGLGSVTILATDNLFILSGGVATITASTMTVTSLTINAGGTIIHNANAMGSSFTVSGNLTWNGVIKTLQAISGSNFFSANGDITGATAVHDIASTRGIYLNGDGLRSINLIQLAGGVTNTGSAGLQLAKNHKLTGNCIWYSPLIFNQNATLDLNGYDLQVSSIQAGSSARLVKCNSNSSLTLSGVQQATNLFLDPAASTLKKLAIDSYINPTGATGSAVINITGNLTTSNLYFGVPTGGTLVRTASLTGNFTLADNGSMRIQTKGAYDKLAVTGNVSIGNATTVQVSLINSYSPPVGDKYDFVTSTGAITGIFATIQNPNNYTGQINNLSGQIEYQVLTGPPPAPACSYTPNPDLPLVPSSSTIEAQINTIVKRFSDGYLGTGEPTSAALNSAVASYNALGITVNGYVISSTTAVTSYTQVSSFLKTFAQYLKFHPEDTTNIYAKALNTVWLVSDRMCKGLFAADFNGYSYTDFGKSAILIPRIKSNSYVKSLFENLLNQQHEFDYFWTPNYTVGINDDHVGNGGYVTMAYVQWIDSADQRYRYMTAFKRFMDNFLIYTPGAAYSGLKPDGSGFHHWAAYPSYMYNLNTAAEITYYLKGSPFQVSTDSYLRLRDALMFQLMISNDTTTRFLTMTGRKPEEINTTISKWNFRDMAVAGGSILGAGTSDPVMATIYNRIWGNSGPGTNYSAQFGNSTVAPFNPGYFQSNHSMAGIYRKDGWLAVCKGFNNNMFGAEIFGATSDGPIANRFGRYQSYGAVNIIYPGDALTGNGYDVTTWDWNFTPGATVIKLPWDKLQAERDHIDELQQKRFVGSLSFINKNGDYLKTTQGTYGLFAMDFQEKTGLGWGNIIAPESHNATFGFKKSVFTFDNMLICLGSNIGNNDAVNNTVTALYQRKAVAGKTQVTVDGNLLSSGNYNNSYTATDNHWIIDNFGTGFYVFAGSGNIQLSKADQQVPQHNQYLSAQTISNNPLGNYAIGYIDHGTTPSNKGYEYVCMPNATATDMANLNSQVSAGNKPYTVHRKDSIAHIVEYKPTATSNSIFGYAFFSALSGINNTGLVTGADYPCLTMAQYDSIQKTFKIAVNNPDLGFVWRQDTPASADQQINITIKGTHWQFSQPNARAAITDTANGMTTIMFIVKDGLPVEIALSRVIVPQTITFDTIPAKTTTDSAFNLTATASSGLPVSYTSSNTAVATINGNTVTIVGKGTSSITASQQGNDVYGTATPVEQTLNVIDNQPPVIMAPPNVAVNTDAGAAIASNVALGLATATDNDGVRSITNNAPTLFPVGITQVIWTAVDSSGNTATATQTVTVTDNENPGITAPADISVNTDAGSATASNVVLGLATATDNDGVKSITNNAPALFPVGTTLVIWTAVDSSGNSAAATQTVTVTDNEIPGITAPATIQVYTDPGKLTATVSLETPATADNCGVASVTNDAPATFPVGTTTVTWTVTDIHGNSATSTQQVIVSDNEAPTVRTQSLSVALVYGQATITAEAVDNGSSDNCGVASITVSPSTFNCTNIGTNNVTLTVTDIHGNSSRATAVVTVTGNQPNSSVTIVPVNNVYTGGVASNLYLGYGPQSVTLQAVSEGSGNTYSWDGNGTLSNTSGSSTVFAPTAAGYYTFMLNTTSASGCSSSSPASISICVQDIRVPGSNNKVYLTHVPTGNPSQEMTLDISIGGIPDHLQSHPGDHLGKISQTGCNPTTTAVAPTESVVLTEDKHFDAGIYPNPSPTLFNLVVKGLDKSAKVDVYIMDMVGRKIKTMNMVPNSTIQFGNDLHAGTYFVVVVSGNNKKTLKIIKL